jgi:hypothetical protein
MEYHRLKMHVPVPVHGCGQGCVVGSVVLGCTRIVITGNIGVLVVRLMPYQLLNMPCTKYVVTGCYLVVWPPVWM